MRIIIWNHLSVWLLGRLEWSWCSHKLQVTQISSSLNPAYMICHWKEWQPSKSHSNFCFQYRVHEEWWRIRSHQEGHWKAWQEAQRAYCCIRRRQWAPTHWATWDCWYQHLPLGIWFIPWLKSYCSTVVSDLFSLSCKILVGRVLLIAELPFE